MTYPSAVCLPNNPSGYNFVIMITILKLIKFDKKKKNKFRKKSVR